MLNLLLVQRLSNFVIVLPPFHSQHVVFAPQAQIKGAGSEVQLNLGPEPE